MHNKYYDRLEKKVGFYELNIDSFNDFIDLLRPDNYIINDLMTRLRIKCTSPEEYAEDMNLLNFDSSIIYRGHGDSQWELKSTFDRRQQRNCQVSSFLYSHTIEYENLKKFQQACDLAGVIIPSDGNELRRKQTLNYSSYPEDFNQLEIRYDWFNKDFFELAAFAQHHGVPTRLLDWSKNPFVASYFANSNSLMQQYQAGKKMSIWVLNFEKLDSKVKRILKILDLPKGINQHISHQQGVLTYVELNSEIYQILTIKNKNNTIIDSYTLNEVLEHFNNDYRLLKINLGFEHAIDLYKYCNAHNFNACHLFRGAYGAAIHTNDIINFENFQISRIKALN
ncbi:FRG domain-containing protein [Acinetobacter soli]|uniref:FRG domain-containing protein n=1 Tax=Acinetobacter soli TaxID=487316 RepID=UPI003BA1D247